MLIVHNAEDAVAELRYWAQDVSSVGVKLVRLGRGWAGERRGDPVMANAAPRYDHPSVAGETKWGAGLVGLLIHPMCFTIASPNSEHLRSVAPSMSRWKS